SAAATCFSASGPESRRPALILRARAGPTRSMASSSETEASKTRLTEPKYSSKRRAMTGPTPAARRRRSRSKVESGMITHIPYRAQTRDPSTKLARRAKLYGQITGVLAITGERKEKKRARRAMATADSLGGGYGMKTFSVYRYIYLGQRY